MANTNNENKKPVANVNMIVLNGRLSQNCNYRPAQTDAQGNITKQAVAYFTLANNEGWLRADGSEAVSYISCQINGKYADAMANYLTQGTKVTVQGRLRTWSTKTPTGQYENNYIVVVDDLELLSRPQAQAPQPPVQQYTQAPAQTTPQQYMPTPQAQAPSFAQAAPVQMPQAPAQTTPQQYMPTPQAAPAPVTPAQQYAAPQPPVQNPVAQPQAPQYSQAVDPFAQQPVQMPQAQAPQPAANGQKFEYTNNPFDMGAGLDNSARFA